MQFVFVYKTLQVRAAPSRLQHLFAKIYDGTKTSPQRMQMNERRQYSSSFGRSTRLYRMASRAMQAESNPHIARAAADREAQPAVQGRAGAGPPARWDCKASLSLASSRPSRS